MALGPICMPNFFIDRGQNSRQSVQLSNVSAQGAAGTIHRVIGEPGIVAKLYKDQKDLPEYREKIAAMLSAPPNLQPFPYNGRTYVQIAWPTASVLNAQG